MSDQRFKVSASVSKKMPISGANYSSEQFGASVEEDGVPKENVKDKIKSMHDFLVTLIDARLGSVATPQPPKPVSQQVADQMQGTVVPAAPAASQGHSKYPEPCESDTEKNKSERIKIGQLLDRLVTETGGDRESIIRQHSAMPNGYGEVAHESRIGSKRLWAVLEALEVVVADLPQPEAQPVEPIIDQGEEEPPF